jgi:EAL domain-containing protein (putative c-di-GMP-specific phosphodiesterase class I)
MVLRTGGEATILRIAVLLALFLVAATIACLWLGFVAAQEADDRAETGHHQALREAVEALQAVAPDLSGDDPRLIRILQEASGLEGLRFDDGVPDGDREVQTLLDRNGRIVGWLNWDPQRSATATMNRISPLVVLLALGFAGLLATALWRLRRLDSRLAGSQEQIRRHLQVEAATGPEIELEEQRFIRRELGRALAAGEFDVHYQPIVAAEGNAIIGLEALLRWDHPTRGAIPPARFIPIAEQTGMIDQLGEFVLRRALSDAAQWPNCYVAVNLSPVQVRDRKFVDLVAAALAQTGVLPARLVLEVTEGVLIENPEAARSSLDDLRALGLKLALDDFGSGYSSLTYLQRLPFDKLKIDRGFVAALEHSANAGVIIQAVITLGRALNMSIVVEGIETEEQRTLVRLAGCDEMQGDLFGKPVPRDEIDRMLAGTNTPRAGSSMRAAG